MPLRPCLEPGCKFLVKRGRCSKHRRARSAEREQQPNRAIYRSNLWRRGTRPVALNRAGYRCEVLEPNGKRCEHVDPTGTTLQVHHYPQSANTLIELGLNPYQADRVRVACETHHGQLEQHAQDGG